MAGTTQASKTGTAKPATPKPTADKATPARKGINAAHSLLLKIQAAQDVMDNPVKQQSNPAFKGRNAKYAGLQETMAVVEPTLKDVGLGHLVFFRGREIVYRVFDLDSGEFLDSALELPLDSLSGNVWQQIGQAFTYMRRYLAQAMFQLLPEDDDAASAPKREAAARKEAGDKPAPASKASKPADDDDDQL